MCGSGIGGLESIVKTDQLMNERGPRRINPFFIPSALINLFRGTSLSVTGSEAQIMLL